MLHRLMVLFATVGLISTGALNANEGVYAGAFGGVNVLMRADASHSSGPTHYKVDFHTGYVVGGFVGYVLGCGFAAELEGSWRSNDADTVIGVGNASGDMSAVGIMLNGIYRFDDVSGFLDPYVGVGMGTAYMMIDGSVPSAGVTVDDSDWVFAYQMFLGLAYPWSECISIFGEYRFFGTTKGSYRTTGVAGKAKVEYRAHSVDAGVRFSF